MRLFSFFIIISILHLPALSQCLLMDGKVINSETQRNIPYASILVKNKRLGTTTNADGYFKLQSEKISSNDTILVSCLNYKDKEIPIIDLLNKEKQIIKLDSTVYVLKEVIIRPHSEQIERLGIYQKKANTSLSSLLGMQIATWIENPNNIEGHLNQVGFYIARRGKQKTPFRIRIYQTNSDSSVGRDLLNENIIVHVNRTGWLWLDVSSHNITLSKNGIFVAMEQIYTDSTYYWKNIKGETQYGQTIGLSNKHRATYTWIKYNGYWHQNNTLEFLPKQLNAMIAIKAKY